MLEHKKLLSETFIITGEIDKVSKINYDTVKSHILSYHKKENYLSDNPVFYKKDHFKIEYHQHIQWTQDWLRDHYMLDHRQTLVPTEKDSIRGIVQQLGENVNTHNNVKEWHLNDSPDVSCLFTVATGEKKSDIVFEYDDGRNKHRRWKVPLEQNKFILFSSDINHYITHNENKDFLVNLSLHFQLI